MYGVRRLCIVLALVLIVQAAIVFPDFLRVDGGMPRSAQYKKPCDTLAETITQLTRSITFCLSLLFLRTFSLSSEFSACMDTRL